MDKFALPDSPATWMLTCVPNGEGTCRVHGGPAAEYAECPTATVLQSIRDERIEQVARYGLNDDLEDGTGPNVGWLYPFSAHPATFVEESFRTDYIRHEQRTGKPTWMHLVREELAEAFMESDPSRLEEELTQVAALAVSWLEKLRSRR